MCNALYDDFKKYYDEVSKFKNFSEDFFIFGNDKGLTPLTYKQAQRRKGEIANKANVKEIRLHDFIHSCASFLVNNGAPVTMVSKYLGHSNSSETLNTYSHLFNTTSSEVINTINRARNIVKNQPFFINMALQVAPEYKIIVFNKMKRLSFHLFY